MIRIEMTGGNTGPIGKALNKALAFTLTDSAKFANQDLIDALKRNIDKPAPFTVNKSGYGVTFAKFGDANPFSESFVKPAQSAYEKFIFEGGVRGLGDAGASAKHVWVPGQRPGSRPAGAYSTKPRRSAYGGIPDAYSQALYDMSKKDFAMTMRRPGKTTGLAPSSQGGVFYGTIKGKTGFWARPKRTAPVTEKQQESARRRQQKQARRNAGDFIGPIRSQTFELRQRGPDGRYISTGRANFRADASGRKRADARVVNKSVPVLLLASKTATHHHQIVAYDLIMAAAHERSIAGFSARFSRMVGSA